MGDTTRLSIPILLLYTCRRCVTSGMLAITSFIAGSQQVPGYNTAVLHLQPSSSKVTCDKGQHMLCHHSRARWQSQASSTPPCHTRQPIFCCLSQRSGNV